MNLGDVKMSPKFQINIMEDKNGLLFSFTNFNTESKKVDATDLLGNVIEQISVIINSEFSEQGKREIKIHADRIQFACPYCRDSAIDPWKKRGNLYINDMNFHCYNCGIHVSAIDLIRDFNGKIDNDSLITLHNISQNAKKNFQFKLGNLTDVYIFDKYIDYAQNLESYKSLFNLKDIANSGNMIKEYLRNRHQTWWEHMAWDGDSQQLYIFNMVDDKRFIAFQTRQFNKYSKQKYLTYNLKNVYKQMFLSDNESTDFEEANKLSTFFGLFTINFNIPISVFEGPLDHFLRKNSVATCSVHKSFPIDIPVQWIFDYDKSGKQKAVEKIKNGEEVFLWTKFLNEFNIKLNQDRKIDYNDLISYMIKNKLQINLINRKEFFSSSHYDIYEI